MSTRPWMYLSGRQLYIPLTTVASRWARFSGRACRPGHPTTPFYHLGLGLGPCTRAAVLWTIGLDELVCTSLDSVDFLHLLVFACPCLDLDPSAVDSFI
jgi:hypothetical protein